jgi:hypothetical protein
MTSKVRFSTSNTTGINNNNNQSSPSPTSSHREPLLHETSNDTDDARRARGKNTSSATLSSSRKNNNNNHQNDDDEVNGVELQKSKNQSSTAYEYFGSGPNLASMPSGVIDKDADTPLASSDDDDGDNGINSTSRFSNLNVGRNQHQQRARSLSRKEAGFQGKGFTTILHTACLAARFDEVQKILNSDPHACSMMVVQDAESDALSPTLSLRSLRDPKRLASYSILQPLIFRHSEPKLFTSFSQE